MAIWTYSATPTEAYPFEIFNNVGVVRRGTARGRALVNLWHNRNCHFCKLPLTELPAANGQDWYTRRKERVEEGYKPHVHVCPNCGWWTARIEREIRDGECGWGVYQGSASLKELDFIDDAPLENVRQYLAAAWHAERCTQHPDVFEATTSSVFRFIGFESRAVGYAAEGAVIVILAKGSSVIGVCARRARNSIVVEQIRSLNGVVVLHGRPTGVFVTTLVPKPAAAIKSAQALYNPSKYHPGAETLQWFNRVQAYKARGYRIELLDPALFYKQLSIHKRPLYASFWEWVEVIDPDNLPLISYYEHD